MRLHRSGAHMEHTLEKMLARSEELEVALLDRLSNAVFDGSARGDAVFGMCSVTFEHAAGLRLLVAGGCFTPAIALTRLQYESLTRAMWLLYVAPDSAVQKMTAELNLANEQAAKNLPSVVDMLDQIRKEVGVKVPAGASEMLDSFREVSWRSLNSYVHGGIHALRRKADGYPVQLVLDVIRNSNALSTMAGMTASLLTDAVTARTVSRIQPEFADCLPPLQPRS
jgi:hypothetical protein